MKVLLLAAGRSNRMQPVKDKNFLDFLGKPLIQHQIEALSRNGFDEIILMAGAHNLERMKALCEGLNADIEVVEQEDLDMGMCGAVMSAKNLLGDAPVLIFSSNDIVEDNAFVLMNEAVGSAAADSYILGKKVDSYFPGGYLEIDGDGFIQNIVEKPGAGNEPSDMVNLVVHYHKNASKLVEYLEKVSSSQDDLYEVALAAMMKDGVKFKAVKYDGFWQPIKFPWHVQKVFNFLFDNAEKGISSSAKISENAVINGDVIIADGVKIFDGAVVNGPVYIGENSVIATNVLVRDSHVGKDCVIGFSTELARSFLGNDVWTHSNYIGDSVIGNNVSFGAGSITGNLRLDEGNIGDSGQNKLGLITGDDIRVAVNTSFMPGVKLGSGTFVGAGIVISEDIPEKSFVRGSFELKISENKCEAKISNRENLKNKL